MSDFLHLKRCFSLFKTILFFSHFPFLLMPIELYMGRTALQTQAVHRYTLLHSAIYFRAYLPYEQIRKEA